MGLKTKRDFDLTIEETLYLMKRTKHINNTLYNREPLLLDYVKSISKSQNIPQIQVRTNIKPIYKYAKSIGRLPSYEEFIKRQV